MNWKHTLIYFINSFFLLLSFVLLAQQNETIQQDSILKDSIVYKQQYGLRVGADISKLLRSTLEDDYKGFEINADYRLRKNLYISGELGNEEKTTSTDFLNSTAKGSYFKAGIDLNMYKNWLDMDNMIYSGFRVGVGTFSQQINSYTIYDTNNTIFGQIQGSNLRTISGLKAIWVEYVLGIKVETFNNLYVGLNLQLKGLITEDKPDNFENIYIPGFNRTYDSGIIGVGYGYSISYLIPIYKKNK